MSSSPPDRCGYIWPEDHEIDDDPRQQSCCWREAVSENYDRCVWHVDSDEVLKSVQALRAARAPPEIREQNSPYAELLDGADLPDVELGDKISFESVALRMCDLSNANLQEANLRKANLSDADMQQIDLSSATFPEADLSCANLRYANLTHTHFGGANLSDGDLHQANLQAANFRLSNLSDVNMEFANLSKAVFWRADLSGANLRQANLQQAYFPSADLSYANLRVANLSDSTVRSVNLSEADLRDVNLTNISVDGETTCKRLYEGYERNCSIDHPLIPVLVKRLNKSSEFNSKNWDAVARAYHDLKKIFSDHGLIGKARDMHVYERRARSLEAKSASGWLNWRYLGSLLSRVFTGYGVKVRFLLFWMISLFLVSTIVYVSVGVEDTLVKNISYSVLAFTVAPPGIPSGEWTQFVVMVETFFGTLSIVLLGYILGNRERF